MKRLGILTIIVMLGFLAACNLYQGSETGKKEKANSLEQTTVSTPVSESESSTSQFDSEGEITDMVGTKIVYQMTGGNLETPIKFTVEPGGRVVSDDGMEWKIPSAEAQFMFDFVESEEFWKLKDNYSMREDCADCLMVYLKVYHQGEVKEMQISSEVSTLPSRLEYLLDQLSQLTVSD